MANIVAIVGRPNVGKSTFFNRLIGQRKAIMDNESGITRDRHYGHAEWVGKYFTVIDTGGYVKNSDDIFEEAIREQVQLAIDEATVILFMVDGNDGLTDMDQEFANVLRRHKKPVIVVMNKADTPEKHLYFGDFYGMGFDNIFPVSSANGAGTGDLLDEVVKHFPEEGEEDPDKGIPKIAVIGRPNVGKSSFLNALLGKERSIVTDIAGTTRDSINSRYKLYGKDFILVDTAGMRRKSKTKEDVEFYSTMRSVSAIEESDVCILILDATNGLESQDLNIMRIAQNNNKGLLILVNKWDLIQKDSKTSVVYEKMIREKLAPHDHIPVIFVSVVEKQRIFQAIEKAMQIYESRSNRIPTSKLNDVMLAEIERYPPPALKGKDVKIKFIMQAPIAYPVFIFYCNLPQYIKENYTRYLENKLRENFGFEGVSMKLVFRKK